MINWFDMPAEGLSNGGLFEVKELEVTENGTYEEKGEMYNKVTVNVEGGGGSSDFSTAVVEVNNYATSDLFMPYLDGDKMMPKSAVSDTYIVPLYKGEVYVTSEYGGGGEEAFTAISGNVAYDSATQCFKITGDCTLQLGYLKPTP